MTKKEWENMTEEEATEIVINSILERELIRPEVTIERAEIILDLDKRLEFVAAKSERLREVKSGEILNKIKSSSIKNLTTGEVTYFKNHTFKDMVKPFQFAGIFEAMNLDTENFISACQERLYYEDETTHVITDNYVERLKLEKYLNGIYSQSDQIPELMNIGGKIDFLICAKYRKEWVNVSKYNPEFDKGQPIDAVAEIQKRIDELKQGAPQTTMLKPENYNISFRLKKVEFVELVKALIKNGNIIGEDKKIFMFLVKAFGLDESFTNDYCKVIGDISERKRENKADFLVRLVDSFNVHLHELDEKKKSNA